MHVTVDLRGRGSMYVIILTGTEPGKGVGGTPNSYFGGCESSSGYWLLVLTVTSVLFSLSRPIQVQ
jgi:hypothetical protein